MLLYLSVYIHKYTLSIQMDISITTVTSMDSKADLEEDEENKVNIN